MRKKLFSIIAVLFLSVLICGQEFPGANYLPLVEKQNNQISIAIKTQKNTNVLFFIHYRTEGMKGFQIRKMHVDSSGMARHRISTETLYGKNLEYFIVEKRQNGSEATSLTHTIANFTEKDSPEIYFQNDAAMAAPGRHREPILNINGSLSTSTKMSDNSEYPGQNYTANGNLRIYRNISKNNYQLDFDTSFVHIDPRNQETESLINLSSMMIRLKRGEMQLEVGGCVDQ